MQIRREAIKLFLFEGDMIAYIENCKESTDWDVSWDPSIALPTSTVTSYSQDVCVSIWTCDDTSGNTWSSTLLHKFSDVWPVSWSIITNILPVLGGDRWSCGRN